MPFVEGSEASMPSFRRRIVSGERMAGRVEKKPPAWGSLKSAICCSVGC